VSVCALFVSAAAEAAIIIKLRAHLDNSFQGADAQNECAVVAIGRTALPVRHNAHFLLSTNLTALHAQRKQTKRNVPCEMQVLLTLHVCARCRACMRNRFIGKLFTSMTPCICCTLCMSAQVCAHISGWTCAQIHWQTLHLNHSGCAKIAVLMARRRVSVL